MLIYQLSLDWTSVGLLPKAVANVLMATTVADETPTDGGDDDDGDVDNKRTVYHMLVDLVHYAVLSDLMKIERNNT